MLFNLKKLLFKLSRCERGVTMVEYVVVLVFVVAVAAIVFPPGTHTGLGKAINGAIGKLQIISGGR